MNQRLYNLSKWTFLKEGQSLEFANPRPRVVVLEVNCPEETAFYILQKRGDVDELRRGEADAGRRILLPGGHDAIGDDGMTFLALVKGRDRLEFAVDGAFELFTENGNAYVYSSDGQEVALRVVEPLIFTRLANRKQRNPELEMIAYQMRLNHERFKAEIEEEANRRIAAVEGKLEQYAAQRDIRAPAERVGGTSEPRGEPSGRDPDAKEATGAGSPVADEARGSAKGPKSGKGSAPPDGD